MISSWMAAFSQVGGYAKGGSVTSEMPVGDGEPNAAIGRLVPRQIRLPMVKTPQSQERDNTVQSIGTSPWHMLRKTACDS